FKYGNTGPAGYFDKYAEGELKRPTARLMSGTEKLSNWYNAKGVSGNVVCAAEKLMSILCDIINNVEACIEKTTTANLVREQYRTFALLVDLQRCIDAICKDESIMVLSETKDILAKFIDDNNAPFIYEKIGNRYDHYMIDEFQDTSVREWNNMLPLLKEALASNDKASVFIVGDIKQSIYRWRGGVWRLLSQQALQDLGEDDTEVDHLEQNWRSLENIVKFNNAIIEQIVKNDNLYLNNTLNTAHAAKRISRATYDTYFDIITRAYSDFKQNPVKKSEEKGYAEVCVYDDKLTSSPFIKAIESAVERGYKYRDILILVRGKKDAELAANELLNYKNERFTSQGLPGFNILMAEALSLENCDITEFVKAVLTLSINPKNDLERGFYNRFLGYNLGAQLSDDEKELLAKISHLSPMEAFEEIVAR
ncbi:MAG: UvrD-helicase domain-containing protein, partial [Alistipes sp.]|nr:UvrD-helicase domain-containing protein [Alistipes sp.]